MAFALPLGLGAIGSASASTSPSPSPSTSTSQTPYFTIWHAGQPMPAVPAGWEVMVWPPQQVMSTLKPGQTVPATIVTGAQVGQMAATPASYASMRNPAGDINLEMLPNVSNNCLYTGPSFLADVGHHETQIMQSYSTVGTKPEQQQKFTYGLDQATSFSVGSSQSGDDGTYTISGYISQTDTNHGQNFYSTQYGRSFNIFGTYFEWGKYEVYNSCPQLDYYETMPYEWAGGTAYTHPSGAPGASNCVPYHPGDGFQKSDTKATTIKAAFSALGFSGTAQTGYTTGEAIFFQFSVNGQLCGVNDVPGGTHPGILVAS